MTSPNPTRLTRPSRATSRPSSSSRRLVAVALAGILVAGATVGAATRGTFTAGESPNPLALERRAASPGATLDTAIFAGGCFWGVQGVFQHVNGVTAATSGYAGGSVVNPGYARVSDGDTGHAEAVRVVFDPTVVSYRQLLEVFFTVAHDPTELNRQGPDVGTQYRSAIFFGSAAQRDETNAYIASLQQRGMYKRPIVTQVAPRSAFYVAEAYHQDYATLHPNDMYIVYNDAPKIAALKERYPALWSERLASH